MVHDVFTKIAQVDDLKHIDESVASSAEVTRIASL